MSPYWTKRREASYTFIRNYMKLEKNVCYVVNLKKRDVKFGAIPFDTLRKVVANGRQLGVLAEYDIQARLDAVASGTQGEGADLVSKEFGKIQCKTMHVNTTKFKVGPKKGRMKVEFDSVFTTASKFWDSTKRRKLLGEDVDNEMKSYYKKYDNFVYIDISDFDKTLSYKFIMIDAAFVAKHAKDGRLSTLKIINKSEKIVNLT